MTDELVLVSKPVIFIANISVIEISVILHIGAPLIPSYKRIPYFRHEVEAPHKIINYRQWYFIISDTRYFLYFN